MEISPLRVTEILRWLGMRKTLTMVSEDLASSPRQPLGEHTSWSQELKRFADGKKREATTEDEFWMRRLAAIELCMIHLARAFVMNPEVMVLQRPLVKYN